MVERIVVGPMHTNAYIYSEWKKECVVLDPGADDGTIIARLNLINMKPRGIVLTHGHIDHTSAAQRIRDHYREKGVDVKIAIHEADRHFMGPRAVKAHLESFGDEGGSGHEGFDAEISALPKPDILLRGGEKLFEADLLVIHTPGHTPGSVCVYSETQGLLFSGDTLLFEDIGRSDMPGSDNDLLVQSIRERILVLPTVTRIFPGHGPFSTIERETRHNPYLN